MVKPIMKYVIKRNSTDSMTARGSCTSAADHAYAVAVYMFAPRCLKNVARFCSMTASCGVPESVMKRMMKKIIDSTVLHAVMCELRSGGTIAFAACACEVHVFYATACILAHVLLLLVTDSGTT